MEADASPYLIHVNQASLLSPDDENCRDLSSMLRAQGLSVSVVIPTLNEAENIPLVLPRLPEWIEEVIIVDGRSTDGTREIAQSASSKTRIVLQEGRGKGDALRRGFGAARGNIIVMLDADGSMDPNEIPLFVQTLLEGADFAKGSRFMKGGGSLDISFLRRMGNSAFVLLARVLFQAKYTDLCYGYNAFWERCLPLLALDADGFEIETMMNLRAHKRGLKVVEVPSFEFARVHGTSRLRTFPDGLRVLRTIVRTRFSRETSPTPPSYLMQTSDISPQSKK